MGLNSNYGESAMNLVKEDKEMQELLIDVRASEVKPMK
jgi:hypothetical protein